MRTLSVFVLVAFDLVRSAVGADLPVGFDRYTVEALRRLPADIDTLSMRGPRGYGVDEVSDVGFEEVRRFKNLRVLHAVALNLTDKSLEVIGDLPNLEELFLSGNQMRGEGLAHLKKLKKLKKLDLSENPLGMDWPSVISEMDGLKELRVVNYDRPLDDRVFQELSKLTKLSRLELNDKANEVTDAGLAALASLKNLTSVNICEAKVTAAGLSQLASLENLQRLRLENLQGISGGSLVWLAKLQKLQELEISGVWLNRDDLVSINKLSNLRNLLVWNVSRSGDNLAIEHLDGMTSLRTIRTNEKLMPSALLDLSNIQSIESIGDDLTMISDAEVAELANLPNLQSLMLDSPMVTEKSLDALRKIKSLRYLCISDKVKLGERQLEDLGHESLKECLIVARYGNRVYYKP